MAKPRKLIEIGKEYGWLTVLGEAPKDATGHIRWEVECRCGSRHTVLTGFLSKPNCKCRKCSNQYDSNKRRLSKIGDVFNGWKLVEEVGKTASGAILYRCECIRCSHTAIRTRGNISITKGIGCINCKPDYHFVIHKNSATGVLPDGTEFQIDAQLIPTFQQYNWCRNAKGYIIRSNGGMPKLLLHWLALGYNEAPTNIIDHINRDKTDCRSANLRVVTPQQNSMNRSLQRNNTSGYTGVVHLKKENTYIARVGLNNRDIYLGQSKDPVECAQMYNIASRLLFGEFCGHRNDVPPGDVAMKNLIKNKCRPYLTEALIAQAPCLATGSA